MATRKLRLTVSSGKSGTTFCFRDHEVVMANTRWKDLFNEGASVSVWIEDNPKMYTRWKLLAEFTGHGTVIFDLRNSHGAYETSVEVDRDVPVSGLLIGKKEFYLNNE